MRKPLTTLVMLSMIVLMVAGCSSIRSDAVKRLIDKEGHKISTAKAKADRFVNETQFRMDHYRRAFQELDKSYQTLRLVEAKHQFVFGSFQNVATKKDDDAYAVAYLISKLYLAEYEGLEKKVIDQLEEEAEGMSQLASRLSDSWKSLQVLHKRIADYSKKSVFASIDPEFISEVVEQAPRGTALAGTVLRHSEQVNAALEEIGGMGIIRSNVLDRGRSIVVDLVDLLERVKEK